MGKITDLLNKSTLTFNAEVYMEVEEIEKNYDIALGLLNYLGINMPDGSPDTEVIVAMRVEKLQSSLKQLVHLKDYKDEHGKDIYYTVHQPIAWKIAKEALK